MVKIRAESEQSGPEHVRAEAAVWLAQLHSDSRSEHTERGFRAWLAADPAHAQAFERLTNTWEATGALRLAQAPPPVRTPRERRYALRPGAIAAALAACAVVSAAMWLLAPLLFEDPQSQIVQTAIGERRSLTLPDGSRVVLNTASRVSVDFTPATRLVVLEEGQARFDVAKNPDRPFVVRAGGKQVRAMGTQFDVRWTDEQLSIVLFEGRVVVTPARERLSFVAAQGVTLEPGERLQFERPTLAVKSQPELDREEAWVAGRAIFQATRLSEAVAEMNRYARRPLELADPALGDLQVTGTFSVDDTEAFARALAEILALELDSSGETIVLRPHEV